MKPNASACRIVTQYQSAGERVYQLETGGFCLDIRISSSAAGPGVRSWHVAAQDTREADGMVISDSAATKTEALGKVAEAWAERASELSLPQLDWPAVTAVLTAVRAI